MSKFSFSIYLNAYSDRNPSNNPGLNNFKWARDLNSLVVDNPTNQQTTIAPGETRLLFSGTRTLLQDITTQYSIALKPLSTNTYVLSAVGGTLPNFRTPRTTGADATSVINTQTNGPIVTFSGASVSAVPASFTGQIPGMTTNVTIAADTAGIIGNSVVLAADGVSDIDTLILNWNTLNPSNTITLVSGNGAQIPTSGNIQLAGGIDAGTALNLAGVAVGDYVSIGDDFNELNQGVFQIIAVNATSFTVANPVAVNEGPIILGATFAKQIQIFSAAGVQVDDVLAITGGFSQATWGSYVITQVYANSLEFSYAGPLPQEGPITTQAIAIYSQAKSLIYLESDSKLDVIVNGVNIGKVEPFIANNASQPSLPPAILPGPFLMKSTIYSLSVTNNGIVPANIFFAAVE